MFISEKEIITVDNKDFIRLSDAMQIIAPTTTNASRWFQQHQELFSPETFVYSDERFPGKKGRIWITVPVGFQALTRECLNAPRLKVTEGVEERIASFLSVFRVPKAEEAGIKKEEDNGQNTPLVEVDNEVDIEFDAVDEASLVKRTNKCLSVGLVSASIDRGIDEYKGQNKVGFAPRNEIWDTDSPNQPRGIVYQEPQEKMILPTSEIPNPQFRIPNSECLVAFDTHSESSCQKQQKECLVRSDTNSESYCRNGQKEEWVDFLQQTLSNLVASYYAKICWLKRAQTEAPVEVQSAFTDLTNTLHDTLIENVIVELVKYKEPESPDKPLDQVEEYLSEGYEISFEAGKEGVLCRLLSGSIGINTIGQNWREAFAKAVMQFRADQVCKANPANAPDSLYAPKANGSIELVNDIGEIK